MTDLLPVRPTRAAYVDLGSERFDIRSRALVMAICNRTPDSFFDKGANFAFDKFLAHVENVVKGGADLLDVGGVKAGPGPQVTEAEELDRVIPAIEAIGRRFGIAISVDTWSSVVAREAFRAGAVMGNDISGFGDPDYLAVAAKAGASVVATHIRLRPRVADPEPVYGDVVADVVGFLAERARRAESFGIPPSRIILDAGLDLGKTTEQSLQLLRSSGELADLSYPLLLSASNKTFLGVLLNLEVTERRDASLAAAALGIARGCRILRVHDVVGTVKVRDTLAEILAAAPDSGEV